MAKKSNLAEFINKAKNLHKDRYNYDKFVYVNNSIKGQILCLKCQNVFFQTPNAHLSKHGCLCNKKLRLCSNTEKWIKKVDLKHNSTYNYSKSIYSGHKNKLTITCKEHGDFIQGAREHLQGNGCPKCGIIGFKKASFIKRYEMATLYFIRCWSEDEEFYKIGITGRDIKDRFKSKSKMPYNYELVKEFYYFSEPIWEYEKEFHKRYKNFKFKPKLKFSGSTIECFSTKIKEKIHEL